MKRTSVLIRLAVDHEGKPDDFALTSAKELLQPLATVTGVAEVHVEAIDHGTVELPKPPAADGMPPMPGQPEPAPES